MPEIRLSTAGIKMYYATEATAGSRPTTGWTEIPEIVEMPEIASTPETIDMTPLSALRYRIKIPGLIDLGDALSFNCNFSQTELTLWNTTIVGAYDTAVAAGKAMWFCIVIPGFTDAMYFSGEPTPIGFGGATVGEGLRIPLPIVPSNEPTWAAAPTIPATT